MRKREENQMSECTFSPKLVSRPPPSVVNVRSVPSEASSIGSPSASGSDVVDRCFQWNASKTEKIKSAVAEKEEKELSGCTFHPQVEANGRLGVVRSPAAYARIVSPERGAASPKEASRAAGVEEYLQRQEKGRALRDLRESIPHATGEKWKPDTTIPVDPQLGRKREEMSGAIKSLRKPAEPPSIADLTSNKTLSSQMPSGYFSAALGGSAAASSSAGGRPTATDRPSPGSKTAVPSSPSDEWIRRNAKKLQEEA